MRDPSYNAAARDTASAPLLVKLIRELNVSRRYMGAYPRGHQVVDASLATVLDSYAAFLGERDEVALGVAGSALLLGDQPVDKANPVMRDFARVLHERGIGVLSLTPGLTREELRRFIIVLGSKREKIYGAGGIRSVWEKSGITSLGIREIRYDLFSVTEDAPVQPGKAGGDSGDIWERFALALKSGGMASGMPDDGMLDPELVAEALNRQFGEDALSAPGDFASILLEAFARGEAAGPQVSESANRRFAGFVGKLTPALRRQFLGAAWRSKAITAPDLESMVRHLPAEVVLDTLEQVGAGQQSIPPFIMQLLRQLSRFPTPHSDASSQHGSVELDLPSRMRTILREQASEEYIPASYQQKLHRMMEPDLVPFVGSEGVQELLGTMDQACMEKRTGEILLLFLKSGEGEGEELASYARNLYDIGLFFLRTGDYQELLKILREVVGGGGGDLMRDEVMALFACEEFTNEVLDGLETWGKPKFDEAASVIQTVGAPFTEALLERLAQSESMSLRRFIMDRLVEIGAPAVPAIVGRLSDTRWYFLRNLIMLVRRMELSETVERLRALACHRDRRVSQEAFRALLEFGDVGAEWKLAQDLQSPDRQTQLAALEVAGMTGADRILGTLHAMLARPGLSAKDLQVKILVVQALGEIGNAATLPLLERLLGSMNLLRPSQLAKLKLEAVSTLRRYPAEASLALLKKLASRKGAVGRRAALLLRGSPGGAS